MSRRPLPPVEGEIKLDRGVGPRSASSAAEAPTASRTANQSREVVNAPQEQPEPREAPVAVDTTPSPADQPTAKKGRRALTGRTHRRAPAPAAEPGLPPTAAKHWRWRLRVMAGSVVKTMQAHQEALDQWDALVAEAQAAGVPRSMLMVALLDAGMPEEVYAEYLPAE